MRFHLFFGVLNPHTLVVQLSEKHSAVTLMRPLEQMSVELFLYTILNGKDIISTSVKDQS